MTILDIFSVTKTVDELSPEEVDELLKKDRLRNELREKAKTQAMSEYYLKIERKKLLLGLNNDIPEIDIKEMKDLEEKLKENQKMKDPKYAAFVTVNPKVNGLEGFEELSKKVEKCLSKYWVTDYCYCYEQRSANEEDIHGLHCHILLVRGIKPSHMEREIRSTFKSIVGIPDKHINIQYKRKEWLKDKVEYMEGKKTGDGKEPKTKIDLKMRELLEIENMYYSPDFFSLL